MRPRGRERDDGLDTSRSMRSSPSTLAIAARRVNRELFLLRHLEAATITAAAVALVVPDDEGAGAENKTAVDGEAARAHDRPTTADYQAAGFDVEPSGLDGGGPSSLEGDTQGVTCIETDGKGRGFENPCIKRHLLRTLGGVFEELRASST